MPPCRGGRPMAVSGPKHRHGGEASVFSDINITPLTDIFLVLLIIFMVTTSVTIESAAHVDLPKAEAQANPNEKPKGIIVTLTSEHQMYVNEKNVTEPQLEQALREALDKDQDKLVVFQGDQKVMLGDMVR